MVVEERSTKPAVRGATLSRSQQTDERETVRDTEQ